MNENITSSKESQMKVFRPSSKRDGDISAEAIVEWIDKNEVVPVFQATYYDRIDEAHNIILIFYK